MKWVMYMGLTAALLVWGFYALNNYIYIEKQGESDLIRVTSPMSGATITSPVTITGEARGTWYFEASFPIAVVDWDGKIIGEGHAEAQADWMTSEFVPFKAIVTFDTSEIHNAYSKRGTLILKKDNPSGLPEHDAAIEIPVVFK